MTTLNFTPGNWVIKQGNLVASINSWIESPEGNLITSVNQLQNREETVHNVSVIAESGQMYNALIELLDVFDKGFLEGTKQEIACTKASEIIGRINKSVGLIS